MPAFVNRTLSEFIALPDETTLGLLARGNAEARFPIPPEQIEAWHEQLAPLKAAISALIESSERCATESRVLLEYPIPRIGKRIDAVLLVRDLIIVIEFKTGESSGSGKAQVEDYAFLLSYFHEPSRGRRIVPLLVRQHQREAEWTGTPIAGVQPTVTASYSELGRCLIEIVSRTGDPSTPCVAKDDWDHGRFKPVPAIIDAAVALYSGMDVFEIGHACSSNESLERTTAAIVAAVHRARQNSQKLICFVTGVPGSGKTLGGLNAVHHSELRGSASFLSGNRPLVNVLKEALIRNVLERAEKAGQEMTRANASRQVETFVHNVHRFAEEYFANEQKPSQQVIVFDEAQRAWNVAQNRKRFGRSVSEPQMLLEIMSRHTDWAVVIALVGGGQEINRGEAGLAEWGRALAAIGGWKVVAAPGVLEGSAATAGSRLFENITYADVAADSSLHLEVSLRSIRAERISDWVNLVLDGKAEAARDISRRFDTPPILTRNLGDLRGWLRQMRRGTARVGLVGSAHAARLRADGLEPSFDFHRFFDWENWFLDDDDDVRSSSRLEVYATQFEIQGLELDWVGVCWGDDLLWSGSEWISYRFNNKAWLPRERDEKHQFRLNAYRVLLTRARQGSIIYVPRPDAGDDSRMFAGLELTAKFLVDAGAREVENAGLLGSVVGA